jgi:CheY-like chemotaxis protein
MRKALESCGLEVGEADGVQEALDRLNRALVRGESFDVVLLDLKSSEAVSKAVVRAIRNRKQFEDTQIILLTSASNRFPARALRSLGIAAQLPKPVRCEHLFAELARVSGRASSAPVSQDEAAQPEVRQLQQLNALSVLVAEDNAVNQRVLTRMLEKLGVSCDLVGDGAAAIEAVRKRDYDAVLMDCQMPLLDGFEASSEIRKLAGAKGQIPIIAVTANAMNGDRERCLAAGMTGYLSKPLRVESLANALIQLKAGLESPNEAKSLSLQV